MIAVPMANPRDAIIEKLKLQLVKYLGSGKTAQQIASGVSAEAPHLGTTAHHEKQRAERDVPTPKVRAQEEAGI